MGKKKGRLPDGSGPQRDRHPPDIRSEGKGYLACCSKRAHEVRGYRGAEEMRMTVWRHPVG